jgi:DNA-binding LytR/AlgR family response regulator
MNQSVSQGEEKEFLFLDEGTETVNFRKSDIQFIQAFGDYVKIHCPSKVHTIRGKISELEDQLGEGFIRVHRSYIVNLSMISKVQNEIVLIGDRSIPISQSYRDRFLYEMSCKCRRRLLVVSYPLVEI